MRILLDSNILLRLAEVEHPKHLLVKGAVATLRIQGHQPVLVPQNLFEFWAVATRVAAVEGGKGGIGLPHEEAASQLDDMLLLGPLLEETPEVPQVWRRLIAEHRVQGKASHDAHLVATMLVHGVEAILTLNADDFRRYSGITVIDAHQPIKA